VIGLAGFAGAAYTSLADDSAKPAGDARPIKLEKVKFDEFRNKIVVNKDAKYTIVDVWATWCGPCKENFPHVVELHRKYAGKGLAVVSLSFDDPADAKHIAEAERFLTEKKAAFRNVLLDEEEGVGFERLNINTIPAVFIFDRDGKEVKRFTWDDPDHQFKYTDVEQAIETLLGEKSAPAGTAGAGK
jgi:thiol-disulfide isomerase/thioredoxin